MYNNISLNSNILIIHKYNKESDPRRYWYSEALLCCPFERENEIETAIVNICESSLDAVKFNQLQK